MGKREKREKQSVLPLVIAAVVLLVVIVALVLALTGSDIGDSSKESDLSATVDTEATTEEATETEAADEADDGVSTQESGSEETASSEEGSSGETEAQSAISGGNTGSDAQADTPAQNSGSAASETDAGISFPYTATADELKLLAVYDYSGYYIEDGTETAIDSVAVLEIENTSSQAIEYAVISLTADGETLTFEVSLLPAGGTALVMEADKKSCSETATFTYEGSEIAALDSFDLCEGQVSVSTDESGAVTVANISGEDISELRLFYKNQLDTGEYVGGIAYTVKLEDLAAGESQTVYPSHFDPEYGVVMMVRIY
ncbi:MAG: hypothetical protein LUC30_09500 [Clostridiales bacterium]|nr:hypothetical protein [Clostridiales bacterium]